MWRSWSLPLFILGRTGRKGNSGTSYTLFTPSNAPKARDLVSVLTEAKQVVNPKLQELTNRGGYGGRSRYGGGGGGYGEILIVLLTKTLFNNVVKNLFLKKFS